MVGRASSRASRRTRPRTEKTATEKTTTERTKTDKVTPCDPRFARCLVENQIRSEKFSDAPRNLGEILEAMKKPITTFSLETYSEQEFQFFRRASRSSVDETGVATDLISAILPHDQATMARNHAFSGMKPFDDRLSRPKPDIYQGMRFDAIPRQICTDIGHLITPSEEPEYPSIVNFCFELKGPKGTSHAALLQVRHGGAMGSRAMSALQNYKQERIYDHQAYAFSATFLNGCLHLFAHHVTGPPALGEKEIYHITFLDSFAMDGNREQFIRGATAIRNMAALASRYCEKFLDEARGRITRHGSPRDEWTNPQGGGLDSHYSSDLATVLEEDEEDENDSEEPAQASVASSINLKTVTPTVTDVAGHTAGLKRRRSTSEDGDMERRLRSRL